MLPPLVLLFVVLVVMSLSIVVLYPRWGMLFVQVRLCEGFRNWLLLKWRFTCYCEAKIFTTRQSCSPSFSVMCNVVTLAIFLLVVVPVVAMVVVEVPVGNGKERGGWERAGGEGVVMGWETGTYGHRCIRSRSWILFGGHPLKLERYRED